ncbi:MAG: Maf family nucleotide pyrophosphatase [Bacteroidota bacterium]
MLPEHLKKENYILASGSPRRQFLLKELGFDFTVTIRNVDETYPSDLKAADIALYLCELKSNAFAEEELNTNDVLITADTIVWHQGQLLGKPENVADAERILHLLSGSMHEVYTGICLRTRGRRHCFVDRSEVWFKEITTTQIQAYIEHCQPYDKAGAYGVQEWIGYVAVEKIVGSFFNVMGFPTHRFYEELEKFLLT